MAQILLINPNPNPWIKTSSLNFSVPMGLLYVGSSLTEAGYSVCIVDTRIYSQKENEQIIQKEIVDALFIGMGVMTAQIPEAVRWIKKIKEFRNDVPIVWGGVHPTLLPKQCLESDFVDIIVKGEGEEIAIDLANELAKKELCDLSTIKGIGFKTKDKQIIINPERPLMDLNKLPTLNYDLIETEKYILTNVPYYGDLRGLHVQSSRGCPYQCTFCVNTIIPAYKKWRPIPLHIVERELRQVVEKFHVELIEMRDENFFMTKKHVDEVSTLLKKFNIKWGAQGRAEYFRDDFLSVDYLKELEKTGLIIIPIGCESGNNRILKYIKKGITSEQIINAANSLSQTNIIGIYAFMVGFPTETKKEIFQTVNLMKKIRKIHSKSIFPNLPMLRPYPGSEIYNDCIKAGYYEPKTIAEWTKTDFSENRGALSTENYPWLEDPKFVYALTQYLSFGLQDFKASPSKIISGFMFICKARMATNFYQMPYEYKTYLWLQNKLKKKNNISLDSH